MVKIRQYIHLRKERVMTSEIETNDRVVIIDNPNRRRNSELMPHRGKKGVVVREDDRGICVVVRLEDGTEVQADKEDDLAPVYH